jgi:hypothetical protein
MGATPSYGGDTHLGSEASQTFRRTGQTELVTMKYIRTLARLTAIIAVAFVPVVLAAGKDMRFPEKGEIAFVLHIPDAWDTTPAGVNMLLKSPDKTSAVSLSVVEDKVAAVRPYDELAKAILVATAAQPYSKHEPGAIGAIKAEAYYSTLVNHNKIDVSLKLLIIKVAQTHVVTETIMTVPNLSAAQQNSLDAVVKGITLTGIK